MIARALAGIACVAIASALGGCAAPSAVALPIYAPPAAGPSADQTLEELSRLRHLPPGARVDVEVVDDAGFLAAFHAMQAAQNLKRNSMAYVSAFGLAPASTDVTAMAQHLADDGLDGFFDQHTTKLYVRQRAKADPSGAARLTLAHEEEHALQDRFFGIPDMTAIGDLDESLAVHALFEGDATVASIVLDLARQGETSAEAIARMARIADDDAVLRRASVISPSSSAVPLLRAQMAWPYVGGSAFVAELAASGGWSLVNAAMRNPPRTTEQVLHVEKYVAGEAAIDVRAPAAPAGYAPIELGRMGELQTRFLLAQCLTDAEARDAARDWGGDALLVAAKGSERAVLWSTVWDNDAAAGRFSAALERRRTCARNGAHDEFTVVRDGARVAFVQGLADEASRAREAATLLSLVGKAPPSLPPVGEVALAHPPIASDFARGVVQGGRFVDPPLGLSSDLAGLKWVRAKDLELSATGPSVTVDVAVEWSPPSAGLAEATVRGFVQSIHEKVPGEQLFDAGTSEAHLPWAIGEARSLRLGNKIDVRFVFAPACQGAMTLILSAVWKHGSQGEVAADAWQRGLKMDAQSPACAAVKTLRDPGH
jgi:hypothetical protein